MADSGPWKVEEALKEDWIADSDPDSSGITKAQFSASLFELADIWCVSVDPAEYMDFLQMLVSASHDLPGTMHSLYVMSARCNTMGRSTSKLLVRSASD